jgi:hypothetical protein
MVSVVISYCNNDIGFLEENIIQAKKFSDDIIVVYYQFSLDGVAEDEGTLSTMLGICEKYKCSAASTNYMEDKSPRYHHNKARYVGTFFVSEKNKYILFLDADEIIEGDTFTEYLKTKDHENYDVVALDCYWYFRERRFRADAVEQAGVLCKASLAETLNYIYSEAERWEFKNRPDLKAKEHLRYNGVIMCHHYSWVRTKEQMLQKVKSWGHKADKDWVSLIEEEFSHEFRMRDFVHNYTFTEV